VNPVSVAVDHSDNLYIADDTSNRIRRVDGATGIIETIAGSGPPVTGSLVSAEYRGEGELATGSRFTSPHSLAFDQDGNLLFTTTGRVCRIDKQGYLRTVAGVGKRGFSGDGGPATGARIGADAIALDERGNLFIAEYEDNRIRRVDAKTGFISTVGGNGLPHRPRQPSM
jgi:sugar lactone lactonase YvrE